jgi:hypothetical protein
VLCDDVGVLCDGVGGDGVDVGVANGGCYLCWHDGGDGGMYG